MTQPLARRALPWFLAIPLLVSIGFNVYLVREIRASLRLTPSGFVSDLYPSWRATHDLLAKGTNPYIDQQTVEYQRGYYGRVPDDPSIGGGVGYQGFVYPLFLCVLLAPLAILPFGIVQWLAILGMLAIIAWSAKSWSALVGWPETGRGQWIAALFWAGSASSLYLVGLQQLTGLVVGILGLTAVAIARKRFGWAGVLLALGMFKPQLTLIAFVGVLLWSWHEHRLRRFLTGFSLTAAVLMLTSLALQPDWPRWFISQARTYAATNQLWGIMSVVPSGLPRTVATAAVVLVSLVVAAPPWVRGERDGDSFTNAFALLVATTLIVNQGLLVYNAVLLIFPLPVVARRCTGHDQRLVRLPAIIGLSLLGLAYAAGVAGVVTALGGHSGGTAMVIDLIGLVFIVTALPFWLALLALRGSSLAERPGWSLLQRSPTGS